MHIDVNGLVLQSADARESDKYLTVLTDKLGKIKITAKGANKKFGGICAAYQPFSYSKMTLFENRGYYQLDCADIIKQFNKVSEDIEKLALCSYFSEAAGSVSDEGIDGAEVLKLCLFAFDAAVKDKTDKRIVKAVFELRLMSLCGYMPEISRCCLCGADGQNVFFDIRKGNTYCANCKDKRENGGIILPLTAGARDAMKYTIYEDMRRIFGFGMGEQSVQSFSCACEAYLLTKTEKHFKTLDFYKSLQFTESYTQQIMAAAK